MSDSPEREQISRELAKELGYEIDERGTWYTYVFQSTIPTYLAKSISDALISQKLRIRELEAELAATRETTGRFVKELNRND